MGKKKQTEPKQNAVVTTNNNTETTVVSQNINYSGVVNIKLMRGNRVVSSKTYHNKGNIPLFKFLCNCLAGDYNYAERPCRIRLFKKGNEEDIPSNPQINASCSISNLIYYNTIPTTKYDNKSCTVTFHFRIPFSVITDDDNKDDDKIHKMALYNGDSEVSIDNGWYAVYTFSEGNRWTPIGLDENQRTYRRSYALVIDWALSLTDPDPIANTVSSTTNND